MQHGGFMPRIGCVILSKQIADLTPLESKLHAKNIEVLIHKDYSSNLQTYDSRVYEFPTRCRWGSPELALAMVESMYSLFLESSCDYVFSISDNTIPSPNFYSQLESLSDGFKTSLIESNIEGALDDPGVNYGITSKFKPGLWQRKLKLQVYKGNQWNALTKDNFLLIYQNIKKSQALLSELYHTKILDERLFATMINRYDLRYNNVRYMYMPFQENGKNVKEINIEEYMTYSKSYSFLRKYNWDKPLFEIPESVMHKLNSPLQGG